MMRFCWSAFRAASRGRLLYSGLVVAVVVFGASTAVSGAAGVRPGRGWPLVRSRPAARAVPAIEPAICSGCKPPLVYEGGPVMGTTAAGVTVTPVFWQPSGGKYAFPAGYESIIDGFVANVAAASGSTSNVFSIATEYSEDIGGTKASISYTIHAGTPIVDTDAFPGNGCTPAHGYPVCITDSQLRTELTRVTSSQRLTTDLAHFYPVFFPPGVETKDNIDNTTSVGDYCGYHRAFGSGSKETVYGNLAYEGSSCSFGQAPNGNIAADGMVSTLSHELNESLTDPLSSDYAWSDKAGNEIGDMCGQTFGRPLGSTSSSDPGATEYNQVINGGKYYLQQEFSDLAFSKFGLYNGCRQSQAQAESNAGGGSSPTSATTGTATGTSTATGTGAQTKTHQAPAVITVVNDATPTTLPANGKSTAVISLGVSDTSNYSVVDDPVHFTVGVQSGTGQCGTLSRTDKPTNNDGNADITYTASTSNVSCYVVAVEGHGGKSAEAVIYQGTTQKQSPAFVAQYPTTLQAGASKDFTIKAANPTSTPVPAIRPEFVIFPGDGATQNVNAGQVQLSYSTTGANGTFTSVPLTGSTINGGAIEGWVGPLQGLTLAPDSTTTYTLHVGLASSVPASKSKPLFAFESFMDQINPANGTGATLADTNAYQVKVPNSTASSNTLLYILITVGVAALAILGLVFWGRYQARGGPPPAAQAA